jgi:hypothetical protein
MERVAAVAEIDIPSILQTTPPATEERAKKGPRSERVGGTHMRFVSAIYGDSIREELDGLKRQ